MKKYISLGSAFLVMLCLGSMYAWSLIGVELIEHYQFSAKQTQLIFGLQLAVFPITMIFVGKWSHKIKTKQIGYLSGVLFGLGYILAGLTNGHFISIMAGIGLFVGIATGCGYWMALTSPVTWFPKQKGLVTGVSGAGFGMGAVLMSAILAHWLETGTDVLQILIWIGIAYGLAITFFSNFIYREPNQPEPKLVKWRVLSQSPAFQKIFLTMFLGTFAGLLIIGNLASIGENLRISPKVIWLSISLFSVANFSGRISWGFIADKIGSNSGIAMALIAQAIGIWALNIFPEKDILFMLSSFVVGFGFGGNFVLFAKKTAQVYGLSQLGVVYPYVFMGYGIAGIVGPFLGGLFYDLSGNFFAATLLAGAISLAGSLVGLYSIYNHRKQKWQSITSP
jgi:OFA family oxalate/formate antiporter-like MFS transporter